ncbi:MAG: hypothetical protein R3E77_02450 [Steroidobacteraceae bacterium]
MAGNKFPDTHWSVVVLAADEDQPAARKALQSLCSAYWFPLFAHLRARGFSRTEAEDLLQGFFVHLIERQSIGRADPLKGSFRGFLLGCLKYYIANRREFESAQRRGGKVHIVSLDIDASEAWLATDGALDPAMDTERDFDRRWARVVMERALSQLQASYSDRPEMFSALKGFLVSDDGERYDAIAAQLAVSVSVIKVTVHRMRAKLRSLLRQEIAMTVSAPHEIDDELRYLLRVLSAP